MSWLFGLFVHPAVAQTSRHHQQRADIHLARAAAPLVLGRVMEHVVKGPVLRPVLQRTLGWGEGAAGRGGQGVLQSHGSTSCLSEPYTPPLRGGHCRTWGRLGVPHLFCLCRLNRGGRGGRQSRGPVAHCSSHSEELDWSVVSVQRHHSPTWQQVQVQEI